MNAACNLDEILTHFSTRQTNIMAPYWPVIAPPTGGFLQTHCWEKNASNNTVTFKAIRKKITLFTLAHRPTRKPQPDLVEICAQNVTFSNHNS